MQFKDLKPNYTISVLNRKSLTFDEAKVISVSLPRFDNKLGAQPTTVVDITLEQEGRNTTYVFPSDANKAYNGDYLFCCEKAEILSDIKATLHASESILADIEKHKQTVTKCNQLLADLDPEQKEKQRTDMRFNALEESLSTTKDDLAQIKNMLKVLTNKETLLMNDER